MTADNLEKTIEIEDLHKSHGAIRALDGTNLTVAPARVFGLLGPNGSGKTTLIKAICGILKPDRGNIRVFGLEAGHDRFAVRKRLGYMPQTPSLYDDLSPAENLRFFGGGFHLPDLQKRLREVLEFVQLWNRRGESLSSASCCRFSSWWVPVWYYSLRPA
ncbi:MAG: ABC transporter ATP-binding protein [Actinomycetota bacterium]